MDTPDRPSGNYVGIGEGQEVGKTYRDGPFERTIPEAFAVWLTSMESHPHPLCGIVKTRRLTYLSREMTRESAIASAHEVADYLKKVHRATRVLLFGSSIQGEFLEGHSDIDLFFEGVPYEREGVIVGQTFLHFSKLDLDLIPAGHAPEGLKKEVFQTGVAL